MSFINGAVKKAEEYEELATNVISHALGNAKKPKSCALCVLGCLAGIFNGLGDPNGQELSSRSISRRSRLCEVLLAFLFHPRTNHDLKVLFDNFDNLAKSTCLHNNPTLQFIGKSQGKGGFVDVGNRLWKAHGAVYRTPAYLLVFQIFERLMAVLQDASRPTSLPRVAKGTNTRHWPQGIPNLLIHGPEAFINSIAQWTMYLPLPIPLCFLASTIQICGRSLVTTIMRSKLFILQLESSISKVNDLTRSGQLASLHMNPQCFTAEFLRQVERFSMSMDSIKLWFEGQEWKMLCIVSDTIIISETTQWRSEFPTNDARIQRTFAHFGLHLNHVVNTPEQKKQLHWMLNGRMRDEEEPTIDRIRAYMQRLRVSNECSTLGCTFTFQDVGKEYQRCGKCGVTSYCSQKCQKKDWDTGAHEGICSFLADFLKAGGGAHNLTNRDLFYDNASQVNLDESCLVSIYDWLEERDRWKMEADRAEWKAFRGASSSSCS